MIWESVFEKRIHFEPIFSQLYKSSPRMKTPLVERRSAFPPTPSGFLQKPVDLHFEPPNSDDKSNISEVSSTDNS